MLFTKKIITQILFFILMLSPSLFYAQTLTNFCQDAIADLENLQLAGTNFVTTSNFNNFKNTIHPIHEKWLVKFQNDNCASGGCALDSDDLRISMVITKMSGLSSKLTTDNSAQILTDLSNKSSNHIADSYKLVCGLCDWELNPDTKKCILPN